MDLSLELGNCGFRIFQLHPHEADSLHKHEGHYQMSIPLTGNVSLQCNQTIRRLSADHRLVVAPDDEHRHIAHDEPVRIMLVGLREAFLQQVWAERFGHHPPQLALPNWHEGENDRFRQLGEHAILRSMQSQPEAFVLEELEWQLAQLFLQTHTGSHDACWHRPFPVVDHPALQRAVQFIHDSYAMPLGLDQIAQAASLNKFYLIQLFRDHFGCTPGRFVMQVRLDRAAQLLRQTAREITDIAFEAGFGSVSSFQRGFKARFRVSPGEYRRQC
ncbi:helix-turn-helix domain-containing protein [Brevibacillus fluminis]|uniref:helix-turn-helix domain-containing protein n=1 Tax=Brevibacillus fluminis TaxID=511487 RepID=UPI003F8BBA3A